MMSRAIKQLKNIQQLLRAVARAVREPDEFVAVAEIEVALKKTMAAIGQMEEKVRSAREIFKRNAAMK